MNKNKEIWFIFQGNNILLQNQDNNLSLSLPDTTVTSALLSHAIRNHSLGNINNFVCHCAELPATVPIPNNLTALTLRHAFLGLEEIWIRAATKAYSIINWDRNHQYCGHCGNKTQHRNTTTFERECTQCGIIFYPRISPCIIVLINKNQSILMARSPHFPKGAYGLIAGFVEAGESIEQAVHREVMEEVNLKIKNLRYFGSQPWPFPDSLMIAFNAEYESGEIKIDGTEIEEAAWYAYDNLPGRPSVNISIASKLIDAFIKEQKNGRSL